MSMTSYEHYKNLWEAVKPIRGRAVDIRPIGERRRDFEQVTRNQLASGEYSYCARLHSTDCVEYLPSGNIILRTGGWETPSTSEFINMHSPFPAWKQNKKVWIRTKGVLYPVGKELILRPDSGGHYEPVNSVLIQKRVVNRDKAKAARAPMKPFLDWANAFMKMSDGWVMHATRVEVFGTSDTQIDGIGYPQWVFDAKATYEKICNATVHDYVALLCALTRDGYDAYERRLADSRMWDLFIPGHTTRTVTNEFYDMRFHPEHIKKKAYIACEVAVDYMDIKEVEPSHKPMSNVV
jgi:hypothetical protein